MNIKALAAAALLAAGLSSVAVAQTTMSSPMPAGAPSAGPQHLGQKGSNSSINKISQNLNKIIAHLRNDAHDYGGNKEKALTSLEQAQQYLNAAVQYNLQHPNG